MILFPKEQRLGRRFLFYRSHTKRSKFSAVSDARFDRRTSEPKENTLSTAAELETVVLYFLNTWTYSYRCKKEKQFGVTSPLVHSTHSSSDLATTAKCRQIFGQFCYSIANAMQMLWFADFAKLFAECPALLQEDCKPNYKLGVNIYLLQLVICMFLMKESIGF